MTDALNKCRTGSQLRASEGFNCFGSPWSEPFSQSAASLQTVILHRWGIKCWSRNVGFIIELSSLQNYKPSSKMWRVGLSAWTCKLLQLALKSLAMLSAWFRQLDMPCLPTKPPPLLGHLSPFSASKTVLHKWSSVLLQDLGGGHPKLYYTFTHTRVLGGQDGFDQVLGQAGDSNFYQVSQVRQTKIYAEVKNIKLSLPPHKALL